MSNPTVSLLEKARDNAHSLFVEASGDSQKAEAAQCLLELALYATSLVDDLHRALNPHGIREASKYYEEFPVLASGVRRANKQQLEAVYALPLGEKRLFKSAAKEVGPATKWNDVRDLIIRLAYPKFERIRDGTEEPDVSLELAQQIRELPPITRLEATRWARVLTDYFAESPGFSELAQIICTPDKTKRRNISKRITTLRERYGGDELVTKQSESGKSLFYAKSSQGKASLKELDAVEATELQDKAAKSRLNSQTKPSRTEQVDSVFNAFYDCLKSVLRD